MGILFVSQTTNSSSLTYVTFSHSKKEKYTYNLHIENENVSFIEQIVYSKCVFGVVSINLFQFDMWFDLICYLYAHKVLLRMYKEAITYFIKINRIFVRHLKKSSIDLRIMHTDSHLRIY